MRFSSATLIILLLCCSLCKGLLTNDTTNKFVPIESSNHVRKYGQDLIVVHVKFYTEDQLAGISDTGIDIWTVNMHEKYFVAAIEGEREAEILLRNNMTVTIDVEETKFVKEAPEKSKEAASKMVTESVQIENTRIQDRRLEDTLLPFAGIPGFKCYRTVEETYAQAALLADKFPDLVEWIDVGDSWEKTQDSQEGYDIFVLKLTQTNVQPSDGQKPKLFLNCAIHAREYATAEFCLQLGLYLMDGYMNGSDADARWILDHHEVHLMLITNPDGRKIAEKGVLWRKNTNNEQCDGGSYGVDLNRNFDFQWGCCVGGSSGSPCSNEYRGPSPASEPEVRALQDYVKSIFPDQHLYNNDLEAATPQDATGIAIDVHSFAEAILWPWGYIKGETAPDHIGLQTLGRKMAFFNNYMPDQGSSIFSPANGVSDDYYYGTLGVAAYTIELGTTFFQDCEYFESTILPFNIQALVYAAKVARTPYITPAGPEVHNVQVSKPVAQQGVMVTITAKADDTRYSKRNGIEPSQSIASCEYFIDTPPWEDGAIAISMAASDGAFSSPVETVEATIDTSSFSVYGRHTIFVQATDSDGHIGAVSAIFIEIVEIAPTTSAPTPSVPGNSCAGTCGGKSPDESCWCDSACVGAGDCCFDACEECGKCAPTSIPTQAPTTSAPTPRPTSTSCANHCGMRSADESCWCDRHCVAENDCCFDACEECGAGCGGSVEVGAEKRPPAFMHTD